MFWLWSATEQKRDLAPYTVRMAHWRMLPSRTAAETPNAQIVYDQEVDTLNQAHEEQREEEKQNAEQKMNEVQVKIDQKGNGALL